MLRVRLAVVFKYALGSAVVLASALASDAAAQQRQDAPAPRPTPAAERQASPPRADDANADLSITARVTADSVRFEKVPNTRVEFTGKPERATVWEAERENLPPQVQPGVTYRNIGVTLRITSVFADIDRIVAEALGEIPVNDDGAARPSATPTTQPPAAPPAQPLNAPPALPASSFPSKSSPANSVTNAPRRRPAQRGRGK
ncbi:MAG TPA: hypothetical protein VF588_04280 [Pyrinomonadaceae bacterium]|jgi:hypothetical protein